MKKLCPVDAKILQTLRKTEKPSLDILRTQIKLGANYKKIYETCISIHQKNNNTKGRNLENIVSSILDNSDIPYLRQATADNNGIIIPGRRFDFVIDAKYGDRLKDKIILSCKRSLRERFLQDANIQCNKLFMITMDHKNTNYRNKLLKNHGIDLIVIGGPKEFNFAHCMEYLSSEIEQNQTFDQYALDYSAEL